MDIGRRWPQKVLCTRCSWAGALSSNRWSLWEAVMFSPARSLPWRRRWAGPREELWPMSCEWKGCVTLAGTLMASSGLWLGRQQRSSWWLLHDSRCMSGYNLQSPLPPVEMNPPDLGISTAHPCDSPPENCLWPIRAPFRGGQRAGDCPRSSLQQQ